MSKKTGAKVFGFKGSGMGAEITPEMLAKINRYALTPLAADQVFARKFLMAHNCVDRDNECFPDEMLDQFAATMPGKSLLVGHNRRDLPCGKFFDASVEIMSVDQFKALTGVEPRLPDSATQVKVLWAWAYLVKTPSNEDLTQQIDGGVCDHCSIGFAAADLVAVRENPTGPAKYWQYVSPGEALEGSLVWLGAQPGATAQKAFDKHHEEGGRNMKILVVGIGGLIGKTLAVDISEEALLNEVKVLLSGKDAKIKELEPLAEDGKSYRADLIADTVKFAALIGEVEDNEKAKKDEEDFLKTVPIARLKAQRDKYEARAREKCPTHAVFTGKDQGDREQRGKEAGEKTTTVTGKKDFSRPEHNELFATVGK